MRGDTGRVSSSPRHFSFRALLSASETVVNDGARVNDGAVVNSGMEDGNVVGTEVCNGGTVDAGERVDKGEVENERREVPVSTPYRQWGGGYGDLEHEKGGRRAAEQQGVYPVGSRKGYSGYDMRRYQDEGLQQRGGWDAWGPPRHPYGVPVPLDSLRRVREMDSPQPPYRGEVFPAERQDGRYDPRFHDEERTQPRDGAYLGGSEGRSREVTGGSAPDDRSTLSSSSSYVSNAPFPPTPSSPYPSIPSYYHHHHHHHPAYPHHLSAMPPVPPSMHASYAHYYGYPPAHMYPPHLYPPVNHHPPPPHHMIAPYPPYSTHHLDPFVQPPYPYPPDPGRPRSQYRPSTPPQPPTEEEDVVEVGATMPPQPASPKRAPPSPPTKRKHAGDYVKKCEHCHTTESPEWRRGPTGPKTLCNACGLRYARNIAKLDTVAHGILAASASSSAALGGRGGGEGVMM